MIDQDSIRYILSPDPNAPARILTDIVSALSVLPFVRGISVFGSFAENRADGLSDVDLLVACDDVENTKWLAADAIRAAKPVLFYRSFTSAIQPSGRYWFVGESPFVKIDISFDPEEEYAELIKGGSRLGHPITSREIYRASDQCKIDNVYVQACPLSISEREQEVGNYIYQSLRSLKRCMRGEEQFDEHAKGFDGLLAAVEIMPRDVEMSGGRIGELAHQIAGMVNYLRGLTDSP